MRKLTLTLLLFAACQVPLLANLVIATSSCGGSPDPTVLCSSPTASLGVLGGNTISISIFNSVVAEGPFDTENPAPYHASGVTRAAVYAYVNITGGTGQGTLQSISGPVYFGDISSMNVTVTEQLSGNIFSPIPFTFGVPFSVYVEDIINTSTSVRNWADEDYTSAGGTFAPFDSNGNRVFGAVIQETPEPTTYAFAGSGILALVMIGRRRSMARQSV